MMSILHKMKKSPHMTKKDRNRFGACAVDDIFLSDVDCDDPDRAWQRLRLNQSVKSVKPLDPKTPMTDDMVRFVCLSDTHNRADALLGLVPDGDVLLHAGDFTNVGNARNVWRFNEFLGYLPHKYKVVIAGNHDLTFDDQMVKDNRETLRFRFNLTEDKFEDFLCRMDVKSVKELLTNCIYLEDSAVEIFGIKIYGSPWQPTFCDWAFNADRGEKLVEKWKKIPAGIDVLMTHGPPVGHGDMGYQQVRCGCVDLLRIVQKHVQPLYHVFGHIHEGYGITTDGYTTYINASNCTRGNKNISNLPIVFDIQLPEGRSKQEVVDVAPVDSFPPSETEHDDVPVTVSNSI